MAPSDPGLTPLKLWATMICSPFFFSGALSGEELTDTPSCKWRAHGLGIQSPDIQSRRGFRTVYLNVPQWEPMSLVPRLSGSLPSLESLERKSKSLEEQTNYRRGKVLTNCRT